MTIFAVIYISIGALAGIVMWYQTTYRGERLYTEPEDVLLVVLYIILGATLCPLVVVVCILQQLNHKKKYGGWIK